MRQHIKNLLERNSLVIAITFTILIGYLSLRSLQIEVPIKITFLDKILHFGAYFVLTLLWLFHYRNKNKLINILVFVFLYGLLLEYFQDWFSYKRTKDLYDVLANSSGIIFATLIFNWLYKCYQKIFVNTN